MMSGVFFRPENTPDGKAGWYIRHVTKVKIGYGMEFIIEFKGPFASKRMADKKWRESLD